MKGKEVKYNYFTRCLSCNEEINQKSTETYERCFCDLCSLPEDEEHFEIMNRFILEKEI